MPASDEFVKIFDLKPVPSNRSLGIYRAIFWDRNREVILRTKVVKDYGVDWNRALEEVAKMADLKGWLSEGPLDGGAFKVASYFETPRKEKYRINGFVEVQDIPGKQLQAVLSDPHLPGDFRLKIEEIYQKRLSHYVNSLVGRGPFTNWGFGPRAGTLVRSMTIENYLPKIKTVCEEKQIVFMKPLGQSYFENCIFSERGFFMLKPDQIILDLETLDMTIIDPF